MIRWLQDNVQGTPTIMEGLSEDTLYKWDGRISIYTGLPAVIGWNWHQTQQRTLEPMGRVVEARNANVNAFYQTTSIGTAWDMLQFYTRELHDRRRAGAGVLPARRAGEIRPDGASRACWKSSSSRATRRSTA